MGKLLKNKLRWAAVTTLGLILGAILLTLKLGFFPVNADAAPSSLEMRIFPMVLHASVTRQASAIRSRPLAESDSTGREIYTAMCAECHGRLDGRAGVLGESLYPPAPRLAGHPTFYSDPELFWVIKHGIRNTGMPSWGNRLSDEDIWNVVGFVKSLANLNATTPH